jgi:hypothetical protein
MEYMRKKAVWLVYDFGLGADYEGLYTWLDSSEAVECGNGVAFFNLDYSNDFLIELKQKIEENVKIQKNDRIYIIYRDSVSKRMKGKFLFGKRKRNPWAGYAVSKGGEEEEDFTLVAEE